MTSFTSASTCSRILCVVVGLALVGCQRTGPAADLDEYLVRLERVLEQGSHSVVESRFPRLPSVRELHLDVPRENIDILEFLRLGRCELQQLVAERNSGLGRMAQPSQRLIYEVNFLRAGRDCVQASREDYPELAIDLERVLEVKRKNLPVVIWEATLGAEEFRDFWRPGVAVLPSSFDENSDLELALTQLASDIERWLRGDYEIDSTRLERQLDLIRRGTAGLQLRAWALIDDKLGAASQVVRDRLDRRPLCFDGMQTPKAEILDSVVREYFVGRIQAWAATLNARYYGLFPAIRELEGLLAAVEPPAYRQWRKAREAFISEARPALADHVDALGPLLEQCNLMPDTATENEKHDSKG